MKYLSLIIALLASCVSPGGDGRQVRTAELLDWPSKGRIVSPYGKRAFGFHPGIDIAPDKGRAIKTAGSGTVIHAGKYKGYGLAAVVDHGSGFKTLYGHNARLFVRPGQIIGEGQKIAIMGSTGRSTGMHLHFEIWVDGRHVDPVNHLPSRQP